MVAQGSEPIFLQNMWYLASLRLYVEFFFEGDYSAALELP